MFSPRQLCLLLCHKTDVTIPSQHPLRPPWGGQPMGVPLLITAMGAVPIPPPETQTSLAPARSMRLM